MGGDTNGNNKGEEDTHKTTDEKISVEEGGMMKKRYNPYAKSVRIGINSLESRVYPTDRSSCGM